MNIPVRSSGLSSSFGYSFSWNALKGYTIGASHGHPGGSGPSPADIVAAYATLTNPDLVAGGQAAVDYYKDNFAITVVTKKQTFVINVIDWNALGLLYHKYYLDNASKEVMLTEFRDKAVEYLNGKRANFSAKPRHHQTIYAALKLYGAAISISMYDKSTSKYVPLVVDAFGEIKTKPCYN